MRLRGVCPCALVCARRKKKWRKRTRKKERKEGKREGKRTLAVNLELSKRADRLGPWICRVFDHDEKKWRQICFYEFIRKRTFLLCVKKIKLPFLGEERSPLGDRCGVLINEATRDKTGYIFGRSRVTISQRSEIFNLFPIPESSERSLTRLSFLKRLKRVLASCSLGVPLSSTVSRLPFSHLSSIFFEELKFFVDSPSSLYAPRTIRPATRCPSCT